ncbi:MULTISPECIES: CMD domain protein [unclassified Pannonibacter]|uniref:CMD domain protein n=1 Tax=unclassified Pannonibacter TaxID=2627228 RepID=UPI001644F382|nr:MULTISPECIES: CMD domain protein [unclassified Pannonibacter]
MTTTSEDIIGELAGIEPGSALSRIRQNRAVAQAEAQLAYTLLVEPEIAGDVSFAERHAVAYFTALLHGAPAIASHYREILEGSDPTDGPLRRAVKATAAVSRASGPYGAYPQGPLSRENTEGHGLEIPPEAAVILGARLTAALHHVHLLVFHPRDASPSALQRLLDAGWAETGIVILSQLVAFLSFQIRAVTGFKALAAARQRRLERSIPAE